MDFEVSGGLCLKVGKFEAVVSCWIAVGVSSGARVLDGCYQGLVGEMMVRWETRAELMMRRCSDQAR
jgi:hypothetical protein